MKPLLSLFITTTLVISTQTCSFADATVHKNTLDTARTVRDEINKNIKQSDFYPTYHFASTANLISRPTNIVRFNGQYHMFYEQNPFNTEKQNFLIGHSSSPDLLHWITNPFAITSSEDYDKDGIYSGGAIVDKEMVYLIYTGRVLKAIEGYTEIKETQNLAMSKDSINFGKSANNAVIKTAPHYAGMFFSSENFRTPYIWKHNDKYYMLVGTRFEETKDGAAVLYKSDDLRNWIFVNVAAIGHKGEMGDLWENPQLITVGEEVILVISTQSIKSKEKHFLNKHNSGWFIGKLDYNTGKFKQKGPFGLFDYGFDFYAPKISKIEDNKYILIGNLNMPESQHPEKMDKWAGMMSIPRTIEIKDGKIYTQPFKALEQLRTEPVYYKNQKINGTKELAQIFGDAFEMELQVDLTNAKSFSIKLRVSETQETTITYDKITNTLKLNRDKSSNPKYQITGEREASLPLNNHQLKLQIFVDTSSVEIFANDGAIAMSSRIYPDKGSTDIFFAADGYAQINYLNFFKLKSTQ